MEPLFEILRQSKKANQESANLEGRQPFTCLGVVTNNEDPTNKRRIKVTMQSTGGQVETDWLWRSLNTPSHDPPLPKIGQTVEVSFVDGDPHKGSYGGVVTNEPNPERAKKNGVLDDWLKVEGDQTVEVDGRRDINAKGHTHHQTQLLMYDLLRLQLADNLPEANEENRGKMLVLKGREGIPDTAFLCLKDEADQYEWVLFGRGDR